MAYLIKNALTIIEGKESTVDVLVKKDRIEKISSSISSPSYACDIINAEGKMLLPGLIDDQVHFREPGLTHKAEIATESRAAVAGGITSFMEMPNTNPKATTIELLEEKYSRAAQVSPANYSFFFGATNENLETVLKVDKQQVCGVKVFMGSSTGNMLVDDEKILEGLFSRCDHLIATHCEKEEIVRHNEDLARKKYPNGVPFTAHDEIRNEEACYASSSLAVNLAQKHGTRLHILHISTAKELELFSNAQPLLQKKITAEACVHHLWFDAAQYKTLGAQIKCNPAIKEASNREAIWKAVLDNRIDVIATDHAPHTWQEKQSTNYFSNPSGLPLVQHSLLMLLEKRKQGIIDLNTIVRKASSDVAECFRLKERGYMREGYKADLVLVDSTSYKVSKENILYKCGWSPLDGFEFSNRIESTWVNGNRVFHNGKVSDAHRGERLAFN